MAFRINYNYLANFTLNQLHNTEKNLTKTVAQLSSGRRIVDASDDVSGFNIVQRMTRASKGIEQGIMNSQDGMSLAQVALSATQQMIDNYQVIRQKALQAANETVNPAERKQIGVEIAKIIEAMDRLAQQVDFNEFKLFQSANLELNGVHHNSRGYVADQFTLGPKTKIQVFDAASNMKYNVSAKTYEAYQIAPNLYIAKDSQNALKLVQGNKVLESALEDLTKSNLFKYTSYNSNYIEFNPALGFDGSKISQIKFEDLEKDVGLGNALIKMYADTYQFMIQYGPEAQTGRTSFGANGTGDNRIFVNAFTENIFSNVLRIQIKDKNFEEIADQLLKKYGFGEGAVESKILDFANKVGKLINVLSDRAADLGSTINQLQSIVNFNEQAKTTIDEATSRIRDVDFAKASARFQKLQILIQSGTSMLAQANQLPQYALRLIG